MTESKRVMRPEIYKAGALLVLLFMACIFTWYFLLAREIEGQLTVAFLNVGQGDAIYIETPHGNQVLVDGGKGMSVLRELGKTMPFADRSIDMIIATHPDLDHIEGLIEVFKRYEVGVYIDPRVHSDSNEYQALVSAVFKEGLEPLRARNSTAFMLDNDVTLHVLFPDRDVEHIETNTASVVLKITYGDTSFMLTGDSPSGIEEYLSTLYGNALHSDVLKLGHHGSRTSTSDIFLGYVDPAYAVISAGCDNMYGHPHKEVVDKVRAKNIQIKNTCENGTIIFKSDGSSISVKEER